MGSKAVQELTVDAACCQVVCLKWVNEELISNAGWATISPSQVWYNIQSLQKLDEIAINNQQKNYKMHSKVAFVQ